MQTAAKPNKSSGEVMGMHFGIIAAQTSVAELLEAFSKTWPKLELVATESGFENFDELRAWIESQSKFVSVKDWSPENPGRDVYVFRQQGNWALIDDKSYVLCSDDDALKSLSARFRRVLSFVIETAGGTAFFACFENGALRRELSETEGELTTSGDPILEENGIDLKSYYMNETEALCKVFGISPYWEQDPKDCQAICVIDRNDYSDVLKNSPFATKPQPTNKPWWKFW